MTTLARFLAGVTLGVIVPLGVILGLAYLSGEAPQVVVHGSLGEDRKSELREVVENVVSVHGRWVAKSVVRDQTAELPWVVKTRVWRTVTNSLHVEVIHSIDPTRPKPRLASEFGDGLHASEPAKSQALVVDKELVVRLKNLARIGGYVVESVIQSSEGVVITLESGTSVLLGNQDFGARMNRFLRVKRAIDEGTDLSRLVADARYDTGVAVAVVDHEDDKSYDTDGSIANDPVVITHE